MAVSGDAGGDHNRSGHDLAELIIADVQVGGVEVDVRELDVAQCPVAEGLDPLIEPSTDPRYFRFGDAGVDPRVLRRGRRRIGSRRR